MEEHCLSLFDFTEARCRTQSLFETLRDISRHAVKLFLIETAEDNEKK
jgi:hypothetical protein